MILLLLVLNSEEDRAIVADLFAKNYHRMKRTAMGILCDPTAAEDAVQDTFVRCITHFDRLKALPEQARSLYLVTAVKNNALNRRRQRGSIRYRSPCFRRESGTFRREGRSFRRAGRDPRSGGRYIFW